MDIDRFLRDPLSRRRLLRAAGASSAVALGGCGANSQAPVATGPDESDQADVEILNFALDLEHMSVAAYEAAVARLDGEALASAQRFLAHEREHVTALAAAIRAAGGVPNRAKPPYEIPRLGTQEDALRYAVDVENTAIAAYIDTLPKLTDNDLRATAASIITAEAEHAAVLLGLLGEPQAPSPFVLGRSA